MRIAQKTPNKASGRGYLDGQMLIAMPAMRDERFARSVIYVCAHSSEGAMGIVVNQPAANIKFSELLVQLEVIPAADLIELRRLEAPRGRRLRGRRRRKGGHDSGGAQHRPTGGGGTSRPSRATRVEGRFGFRIPRSHHTKLP